MNTESSLAQASSHVQGLSQPQPESQAQVQARKRALTCSIPGVISAGSLLPMQQSALRGRAVVELTIGTDPQTLVSQAVDKVRHPGLNRLLSSFMQEPEIREVMLCMPASSDCPDALSVPGEAPSLSTAPTWPIQRLRRAAELAQYLCAVGRDEREVLYVATLLQGCQPLLNQGLQNTASRQDVLRTLVRKSLHQLEESHPRQAWLLRQAMGWGLEDEVDDFYVPRLQQSVARSLSLVVASPTAPKLPDGTSGTANPCEFWH